MQRKSDHDEPLTDVLGIYLADAGTISDTGQAFCWLRRKADLVMLSSHHNVLHLFAIPGVGQLQLLN